MPRPGRGARCHGNVILAEGHVLGAGCVAVHGVGTCADVLVWDIDFAVGAVAPAAGEVGGGAAGFQGHGGDEDGGGEGGQEGEEHRGGNHVDVDGVGWVEKAGGGL
jgi:hypothetical protein